jgi:hypothetical protein
MKKVITIIIFLLVGLANIFLIGTATTALLPKEWRSLVSFALGLINGWGLMALYITKFSKYRRHYD